MASIVCETERGKEKCTLTILSPVAKASVVMTKMTNRLRSRRRRLNEEENLISFFGRDGNSLAMTRTRQQVRMKEAAARVAIVILFL